MSATNTAQNVLIPTPELVYVTPEMAAEWLSNHNTQNRSIRGQWVTALASEITSGRWMMTGDPVRFDEAGNLIDGQHRLAAIARSNIAVPLYVIKGLPLGVRDVIDTGASRTASDTFTFAGYKNSNNLAAAARVGLMRSNGYLRSAHDTRSMKFTNSALIAYVVEHPDLADVVNRTVNNGRNIRVKSLGAWSYALWRFALIDIEQAIEFESSIVESRTDGPGDARLALIRFFANETPKKAHRYSPAAETLFALNRTWNAWRTHETLTRIITRSGMTGPDGVDIPEAL